MTDKLATKVWFERAGRIHKDLDKNAVYDHLHFTCPDCNKDNQTIYSSALDKNNVGVIEYINCKCGTAYKGIYKPEKETE